MKKITIVIVVLMVCLMGILSSCSVSKTGYLQNYGTIIHVEPGEKWIIVRFDCEGVNYQRKNYFPCMAEARFSTEEIDFPHVGKRVYLRTF